MEESVDVQQEAPADMSRDRLPAGGVSMERKVPDQESIRRLCRVAVEMRQKSYVPYSHFRVGAALMTEDGEIFTGCNIENAAYTPSNCAERTAFFKAISEGHLRFTAIAISGGPEDGELQYCPPCGVCRQIMAEFCCADFPIFLAKSETDYEGHTLGELLPMSFTPDNLKRG